MTLGIPRLRDGGDDQRRRCDGWRAGYENENGSTERFYVPLLPAIAIVLIVGVVQLDPYPISSGQPLGCAPAGNVGPIITLRDVASRLWTEACGHR